MNKDKLFIAIISGIILSLSLGIFIRGKKEISIRENRELSYFTKLSKDSFMSSKFQTDTEDALVDQVILGERFKGTYNSIKNNNFNLVVGSLKALKSKDNIKNQSNELVETDINKASNMEFELEVIPKGNKLFELEESNHLVFAKSDAEDLKDGFNSKAYNYNKLVSDYPDLDYNIYYIESDGDADFINGVINHDLIETFYSGLDSKIKKSAFYINSPADFQKYFYKTDHHWNELGQLEGYKQIIRNLKGEDEKLLDVQTISIDDVKYNGYKSREIDSYNIYDDFKILYSDLPKHRVYINGKEDVYGNKEEYIKGNFNQEKGWGHYGDANGGDFGVVRYDFNDHTNQNLLVFVDSFSNPIKELVASHYNNTYYVDLRDYESAYGKPFEFGEFIKENEIDQVLFTGYYISYSSDIFKVED